VSIVAGVASGRPVISVIVPAYNAARSIRRSLASLRRQTFAGPYEVIVVWSGDDATPEIVADEFPDVVAVGQRARLPTGAARNRGLAVATGELIAFLAADCEAGPDWLASRVEAHHAGHDLVGGAVVWAEPANALARASHLLEYNACLPGRPREVSDTSVYNLSFRRELFDRFGRYDESLPCGEDTALVWKLVEAGQQFLYDPAIRIAHPGCASVAEFWRHQRWHGYWLGKLSRRRQVPGVRGHGLRRYARLIVMYPAARLGRLASRLAAWQREWLPQAVLLSPLLLLGVVAALWGLLQGLREPDDAATAETLGRRTSISAAEPGVAREPVAPTEVAPTRAGRAE